MDKNMIKIDDLVRSRLGGAEEREPAGAWGAMRDLLDKEMPVQTAASFNWRRMLGYATGLIIATSVAVGGYKAIHSDASRNLPEAGESMVATSNNTKSLSANNKSIPSSSTASTTADDVTFSATRENAEAVANVNHTLNKTGRNSTSPHTIDKAVAKNANHAGRQAVAASSQSSTSGVTAKTGNDNLTNQAGNNEPVAGQMAQHQEPAVTASNNKEPRQTTADVKAINQSEQRFYGANASGIARNKPVNGSHNPLATTTGNHQQNGHPEEVSTPVLAANRAKNNQPGITAAPGNNGNKKAPDNKNTSVAAPAIIPASGVNTQFTNPGLSTGSLAEIKRPDSIRQIEIKHRLVYNPETEKMVYQPDTLGFRKVGVDRPAIMMLTMKEGDEQPVVSSHKGNKPATEKHSADQNAGIAKNEEALPVVPQSSAQMNTVEAVDNSNNNLVSLSKFRVSSKFNKLWDANAQRFNAFVQNVNIAMAKAQLYGGITGGFNTTVFSANTLAGFQLGLTGILVFNERWSIAADLKYNHRFNTASINDNYAKVSNIVPGAESQVNGVPHREYTWDQESIIHYYNLTAVQTLELPVTLRYNIGRIFGEVGLNMMYSLPINAEEVERSQGNMMTVTRNFPANTSPSEGIGGGKHVTLQDFNSRFGMGYVIGAGYEFTPALNANVRLVQNVWDNAVGSGAAKVSRNLYQTPSIQFSVGYRFSQGARKH
jgi:hypothetical protein